MGQRVYTSDFLTRIPLFRVTFHKFAVYVPSGHTQRQNLYLSKGWKFTKKKTKKTTTKKDKLKPQINILHRTENYCAKMTSCRWSIFIGFVFPYVEAPAKNKICSNVFSSCTKLQSQSSPEYRAYTRLSSTCSPYMGFTMCHFNHSYTTP